MHRLIGVKVFETFLRYFLFSPFLQINKKYTMIFSSFYSRKQMSWSTLAKRVALRIKAASYMYHFHNLNSLMFLIYFPAFSFYLKVGSINSFFSFF